MSKELDESAQRTMHQLPLFDFTNDEDLQSFKSQAQPNIDQVAFSDYVVYVDESGDHGLEKINPDYPTFVLAFGIFHKRYYAEKIVPAIEKFKFNYFGHDLIVLHEHEIRKKKNAFNILNDQNLNRLFLDDLSQLMQRSNFILVACVIDKYKLKTSNILTEENNPYHLALGFCLEGLYDFLAEKSQLERKTHILVECRGKKEDTALELEFRRMIDGNNRKNVPLPFEIVFVNKQANSTGLQLADLVARPIGIHYLRPEQGNRAFDMLKEKFMCRGGRSCLGQDYEGYGLKIIPQDSNNRNIIPKKAKSLQDPPEA
tara:strand:- start:3850 stop:4794 length:945 start_codon:yes stop_codon:yes gene_type:complete